MDIFEVPFQTCPVGKVFEAEVTRDLDLVFGVPTDSSVGRQRQQSLGFQSLVQISFAIFSPRLIRMFNLKEELFNIEFTVLTLL